MGDGQTIATWVDDARRTTFALVEALDDEQLMGPQLEIVNPLLWELGHLAWFQEYFVLRQLAGREPLRPDADTLWNSSTVAHDIRWDLPLPSRKDTLAYMDGVREGVVEEALRPNAREELLDMTLYTVFHEDWHDEAIAYTHQTHGWPAPAMLAGNGPHEIGPPGGAAGSPGAASGSAVAGGDAEIPGGVLELGARPDGGFVFDNEKWSHPVEVAAFRIAHGAVSQGEFAAFADDRGYERPELWSEEGWQWRQSAGAEHPVYWRRSNGGWERRRFDRWLELESDLPVTNVNWFEASAFCRWAGRRLPTEAEWELAAGGGPSGKRRYPWGEEAPAGHANLDLRAGGPVPVDALPAGDSAQGVRQLLGNVWEWTDSTFEPYPGFEPDRYEDNSEPWFGSRKVLRGGSFATRGRLVRNTLRNYFPPDRRDVWAGFRTCAKS
jgi:iron(II)-dependent oxidoreductase